MGKLITFYLGKAPGNLASRQLTIYNVSVHPRTTLYNNAAIAAATETVAVDLQRNLMCEAVQTDTLASAAGLTSVTAVLKFNTNATVFPAPKLEILAVDDTSSSSSSSSSVSSESSSSHSSESSSSSVGFSSSSSSSVGYSSSSSSSSVGYSSSSSSLAFSSSSSLGVSSSSSVGYSSSSSCST